MLASTQAEHGGAVIINNSTASLRHTTFTSNTAVAGGAITTYAGSILSLGPGSSITGNTAFIGGGVAAYDSQLILTACTLASNKAPATSVAPAVKFMEVLPAGLGGALFALDCSVRAAGARWLNNSADGFGGGGYLQRSAL